MMIKTRISLVAITTLLFSVPTFADVNNIGTASQEASISMLKAAMTAAPKATTTTSTSSVSADQIKAIEAQAPNLNPKALDAALKPYEVARAKGLDPQQILTVVDFSKPSTDQRFYVIDFKNNKVLFNTLVAHGKNSGDNYATHFSNQPGSDESSLGLYVTQQTQTGHDGYELVIKGVTPGYNTNAQSRAVIVHGAAYVSPQFAQSHDRLGRSWGCFALDKSQVTSVINTIKDGSLIFAYAPDQAFLNTDTTMTV